jgi:hypothetical protein
MWHRQLQLIDHGAALVFHHSWPRADTMVERPYDVSDHVLSTQATARDEADADLSASVTPDLLAEVLALVPDVWLCDEPGFASPGDVRTAYVDHLSRRVAAHEGWRP